MRLSTAIDSSTGAEPGRGREAPASGRPASPFLAARVLQFQALVLSQKPFDSAAAAFATEVASALGFDRAVIGFVAGGGTRIVATSHTAEFTPDAELFRAFTAAMDEALDQATTIVFPAPADARPVITQAHAHLHARYGGAVFTIPLVANDERIGALTVASAAADRIPAEDVVLCEHLAALVGPILHLKRECTRPWYSRLWRSAIDRMRIVFAPGRTTAKFAAGLALAATLGLLLVPVPYRIGGEARIEGSVQRALAAPGDGFLKQVYARPGDRIKASAVLVELAADDLRLDQRKWQSELEQHESAASAALARADRAQYVINQAKADEARAQLDLVEAQVERARVVAPFDGIVIKGDLAAALGSPVRRGDVLLTVAPDGEFRLIVEIDERDVAGIAPGQKGSVALGALTERGLAFQIARVTPVAVARDGRNFFEVEARLAESPPLLRPGLQGVAKIEAGRRPLVWISTHRIVDALRLALWSWGL